MHWPCPAFAAYMPRPHALQLVLPAAEKLPATQSVHLEAPEAALAEPGAHGVGRSLPAEHELPGGQGAQLSADVASSAVENVPAAQGCGVVLPSGQKCPPMHDTGDVVAGAQKKPLGHSSLH